MDRMAVCMFARQEIAAALGAEGRRKCEALGTTVISREALLESAEESLKNVRRQLNETERHWAEVRASEPEALVEMGVRATRSGEALVMPMRFKSGGFEFLGAVEVPVAPPVDSRLNIRWLGGVVLPSGEALLPGVNGAPPGFGPHNHYGVHASEQLICLGTAKESIRSLIEAGRYAMVFDTVRALLESQPGRSGNGDGDVPYCGPEHYRELVMCPTCRPLGKRVYWSLAVAMGCPGCSGVAREGVFNAELTRTAEVVAVETEASGGAPGPDLVGEAPGESETTCENCGTVGETEDLSGRRVCAECRGDYSVCTSCSEYVHCDDVIDHSGDSYCEACYGETFSTCLGCDEGFRSGDGEGEYCSAKCVIAAYRDGELQSRR